MDDEARETPSAKAMLQKWEEFMEEDARKRKQGGKKGAEGKARSQWCAWYEVTLQRDRPQKGAPSVEITLCSQGDDDAVLRISDYPRCATMASRCVGEKVGKGLHSIPGNDLKLEAPQFV